MSTNELPADRREEISDREDRHVLSASRTGPPAAPSYEVQRELVCDEIFAAGGARVVLICAPAGFGKTTVMRQVRERCDSSGVVSAWLNLDQSDNDVSRFMVGLAEALEGVMPGLAAQGASSGTPLGDELAVRLLERLGRHREPFVLFLDDFEALQSSAALGLVRQMIATLPSGGQLVIGSRQMPDVGLGRLRAGGWLLEIEPSRLRFSVQETTHFIEAYRRLELTPDVVERLHVRTEGWAAGLVLASLALTERMRGTKVKEIGSDNPVEFISRISGSDVAIAEYLAEDVLAHQSDDIKDFLMRTSILSSLTVAACDAIRVSDDSRDVLERLARANLFLTRLDSTGEEYRYHGLFSEFLRSRLKRERPTEIPGLHLAAAEWYRRQMRIVPAIDHALASGDLEYALPLLAEHAVRLLADARMRLLSRWLGGLAPGSLDRYPMLRIIHAWAVNFTRGPSASYALIERLDEDTSLDEASLPYLVAIKTLVLLNMDRVEEAHALAVRHYSRLPPAASFARSMLANGLGTALIVKGRFSEAQQVLGEARQLQAPSGATFSVALSESVEAAMDLLRGRLRQAIARLRGAVQPRSQEPSRYAKANALAGVLLAEALYEADECDEAERLLIGYVPLIEEGGLPDQLISGHVLRARLLAHRGEHEHAFQLIMELEHIGHRLQLPRAVASARLERSRLALVAGNLGAAEDELDAAGPSELWRKVEELHFLANDADTFEVARLRLLIRKGAGRKAIPPLTDFIQVAERGGRFRRELKLRILLAEALLCTEQTSAAVRQFDRALKLGSAEGFVRAFADEGEGVVRLVQEWLRVNGSEGGALPKGYVDRILQASGKGHTSDAAGVEKEPTEPLTRREIAVLRLLADGLSNRVLAERLFLSETTVRTHLRNINIKLDVHSRVQALAVARRNKLI